MRQRLIIFGGLIGVILLLIVLNAASYQQKEKVLDNEFKPNRSTYNAGSTGSQAFYSLLSETGRSVVRWQEPPDALKTAAAKNKPKVFVVIGRIKRDFTEAEAVDLYQWAYDGGRLVIIDRESEENLIRTARNWKISFVPAPDDVGLYNIDPADQNQITDKVEAAKPVQPSAYMSRINAVQPSRFASSIEIERITPTPSPDGPLRGSGSGPAPPPPRPVRASPGQTPRYYAPDDDEDLDEERDPEANEPPSNKMSGSAVNKAADQPAKKTGTGSGSGSGRNTVRVEDPKIPEKYTGDPSGETSNKITVPPRDPNKYTIKSNGTDSGQGSGNGTGSGSYEPPASDQAPVAHLANNGKTILVDVPYGAGSIVYLSDPYIVSNAGIRLVDNAQLAINVVSTKGGIVAFDEYHQGFGTNSNRLFQYFAGTPVISIFVQCAILVGFIFFSQSRRFARPVPEPEANRLSKLEYVAAMAELQARTKAFDLAIENIYTDFRRRAARLLGVDNYTTTRKEMSQLIADRVKLDPNDVEDILFQCEEIMHGEPTNKKEVLALIGRLRAVEEKLGLKRTGRTRI